MSPVPRSRAPDFRLDVRAGGERRRAERAQVRTGQVRHVVEHDMDVVFAIALDISDRVYVMGHGAVVFEGTPEQLRGNEKMREKWLAV